MSADRPFRWVCTLAACVLFAPYALSHPGPGIVVDSKGQVYFVDGIRNRIMKLESNGKLTTFAQRTEGKTLSNPHHLVLDKKGNLYSVGDRDGRVCKVTPDGKLSQVYPPTDWIGVEFVGSGGNPFTMDATGTLYCIHYRQWKHCQILTIGVDGRLASLAGGDWGFAHGKGTGARFSNLHGASFAWDRQGALLVTDNGSSVRRIASDGTVTTVTGGEAAGFADGQGKEARFDRARGLAVDGQGSIYVADSGNRRIRKVTPDGKVMTVAGSGKRGRQDGPSLEATFESPTGVAVGIDGAVYVLDFVRDNPRVRKLGTDGRTTTVAVIN
jgi:sugar lactone lactonase YvrE